MMLVVMFLSLARIEKEIHIPYLQEEGSMQLLELWIRMITGSYTLPILYAREAS
jgi:hypothetical protein